MKGFWYIVKKENINEDSTYSFLNSGASGMVYVNEKNKRVVKIIRLSEEDETETKNEIIKAKQEVEYQKKAAKFGLAPRIYHDGYIEKKNSFCKTHYYYIIMDYLSPDDWEHIFADKENKENIIYFIKLLVEKVGIVNIVDPQLHFYKNKINDKVVMIDYDRCIKCIKDKKECVKDMINAVDIHGGGKRKTYKRKSYKRKTYKKKNKKNRSVKNRRI
jgi:hypothetical protein